MKGRRIISGVIISVMLLSVAAFAVTLYPYAKISFSGMKIVTNDSTVQGFVDIYLKKINASGISFCLEYDDTYLQLSDVATNKPIENDTSSKSGFNLEHAFFEQNEELFPGEIFNDIQHQPVNISANMPIIGIADPENAHFIMNFLPRQDAADNSEYISIVDYDNIPRPSIMANDKGDLKLGRISFKIIDPVAFSKLSKTKLNSLIKVIPFSKMISDESAPPEDTGIHLSYVDENGDIQWYIRSDLNIEADIELDVDISDVALQVEELTVSSYEAYNTGGEQDLFDLLNEKMSMLTITYADGSQVPAKINWAKENTSVVGLPWKAKGGYYEATYKYNDDFFVTAKLTVNPVNLVGFQVDKQNITYLYDAENPITYEQLDLPQKATPVFDTYLPNGAIAPLMIEWYSTKENPTSGIGETVPEGLNSGSDYTSNILGHLGSGDTKITNDFAWLTVPIPIPEINITRSVVTDASKLPKELTASGVTDKDTGAMTITAQFGDDPSADPIQAGTEFLIKMPGGELIDTSPTSSLVTNGHYSVTINADGTATIVLSPDIDDASERKLAQLINLGSRAGSFEIAAKEPDKPTGSYTSFVVAPRRNVYQRPAPDKDYEFDYSTSLSTMFPVKAGETLPTTVTLPTSGDRIITTYDGYDGLETGKLRTFTVDEWTITGDTATPGAVVTAVGKLSNTSYTNYGEVFNDDNIMVTIKYLVAENKSKDSVAPINNFTYDTQQVGYEHDLLQTKSFAVKNTGTESIYGLSAVISLSKEGGKEAFVMTKDLPTLLGKGETAYLDITTRHGMPTGKYVCTVSILSNNGVLETFDITFEVTDKPVYKIKITVNDEDLGSAKTKTETYTSIAQENIELIATPEEDCRFVDWIVVSGGVTLGSVTTDENGVATCSFEMPNADVELKANFEETLGAKLRATELMVKDKEGKAQDLHNDKWESVTFDPVKREYYVAVSPTTDEVNLWFKLREEAKNADLELKYSKNGEPDPTPSPGPSASPEPTSTPTPSTLPTPTKDPADEYYKTELIGLEDSPVENIITLNITYNDPDDDPDEGEVKRSYIIHVYKKLDKSKLMTFKPGNSPYGLIERDGAITDKEAAQKAFTDNKNTFTTGFTPSGGKVGTHYSGKAWPSGKNYDWDASALFVINNADFTDPGYSKIRNSIGKEVTEVTKKIKVNILTEANSDTTGGSSDDFVYIKQETIDLPASGTISALKDKRIRPDCYELVYSFTDYDGSTATVSKPLIILNPLGDVSSDKNISGADISRILHRFSTDLADSKNVPDYGRGGLLFKYRVCDANKSGNVNAADANNIRAGGDDLSPFYTNLLEGGDT